jgi:phage shock protein PspC (stress-responsive transcriptional regulator)
MNLQTYNKVFTDADVKVLFWIVFVLFALMSIYIICDLCRRKKQRQYKKQRPCRR